MESERGWARLWAVVSLYCHEYVVCSLRAVHVSTSVAKRMIATLVLASLTTACATHTFTLSQICKVPREWLARQLHRRVPSMAPLVTCQYCLSHWIALGVLA